MVEIKFLEEEAKEVIQDVKEVVIAEYPNLTNSLEFLDKYKSLLSKLVAAIGYRFSVVENLSNKQYNCIWNQFNIELNKMYDELLEQKSKLSGNKFWVRDYETKNIIGGTESVCPRVGGFIEVAEEEYQIKKMDKEERILYVESTDYMYE